MWGTRLRRALAAKPPLLGARPHAPQPARTRLRCGIGRGALGGASARQAAARPGLSGGRRAAQGLRAARAARIHHLTRRNVSERRERSERSELFDGPARPSSAAKSARSADRPRLSPGRVPPAAPLERPAQGQSYPEIIKPSIKPPERADPTSGCDPPDHLVQQRRQDPRHRQRDRETARCAASAISRRFTGSPAPPSAHGTKSSAGRMHDERIERTVERVLLLQHEALVLQMVVHARDRRDHVLRREAKREADLRAREVVLAQVLGRGGVVEEDGVRPVRSFERICWRCSVSDPEK